MNIAALISLIKELGLFNIVVLVCILNAPSIVMNLLKIIEINKTIDLNKQDSDSKYLKIEVYEKNQKAMFKTIFDPLREDVQSFRESIDKLKEVLVRNDERLNLLNREK